MTASLPPTNLRTLPFRKANCAAAAINLRDCRRLRAEHCGDLYRRLFRATRYQRERALRRADRRDSARQIDQLQQMTKLLTLCAWTKQVKVRGEWKPIESYLRDELGIIVTHGIAEECAERLLAEAGVEFGATHKAAGAKPPTADLNVA